MAETGNYQVMGIAPTAYAALEQAQNKLPFPVNSILNYARFATLGPTQLTNDQGYSVTIDYSLTSKGLEALAAQSQRGVPSTATPVAPKARGRPRGPGAASSRLEQVVGNLKV